MNLSVSTTRFMQSMLVALLAGLPVMSAFAAEIIEELLVTAQKREQALLDVPMSVSAVTSEEIEAMGATNLDQIQSSVPSFKVATYGSIETFQLRGVSPAGSLLPTVGRYLDDLALNTEAVGFGVHVPLVDMQRVEILKGPQGTLWGEGSLGGTVIYKTLNPTMDGEIDGFLEISASDVSDGNTGWRVTLGGDVIDTGNFGLRLTGFYEQKAGWVDSVQQGDDYNDGDRAMFRAKAVWDVSDSFSASLLWQHQEFEQDGIEYTGEDFAPSTFILSEKNDDEYDLFNLVLNWDLGDFSITSSTGYVDRDYTSPFDLPGLMAVTEFFFPGTTAFAPLFGNPQTVPTLITAIPYNLFTEIETFSQEIRVAGSIGENFYYTVGGFYKDSEFFSPTATEWYPDPNTIPVPALSGQLYNKTEALALFAEGTFTFNDMFEVTAGVRWYDDERDAEHVTTLFGVPTSITETVENDDTVYRLVFKWNINEDNMAYVSASEGFRSGGTQFIETAALGIPNTFDPEELTTYEVGAKGTLADGRLTYETAVYLTEYENIQVYIPNPFGVQAFVNGGEVDMVGVEL
ncbi:MAG: TonB-dependent receptor, partial [Pseudomonadales bacterium]|nr:TonB-dependent receptor [Pseudomonadales bacterium]